MALKIKFTNITSGATEPQAIDIAGCLTDSIFMKNKCSGYNYGVVVEPFNWWVAIGAYLSALGVIIIQAVRQDTKRNWLQETLLYGTVTVGLTAIIVSVGFNAYILNYLFDSPKYFLTFLNFGVWGGIVAIIGDSYYYRKNRKRYRLKPALPFEQKSKLLTIKHPTEKHMKIELKLDISKAISNVTKAQIALIIILWVVATAGAWTYTDPNSPIMNYTKGFQMGNTSVNATDVEVDNVNAKSIGGVIYAEQYTDLLTAINVAKNGSNTIFLGNKTYTVTNLKIPSGITMYGIKGQSIVKGSSGNVDVLISGNYPGWGNCNNTNLKDFTIDGNKTAFSGSGTNSFAGCYNMTIENLDIYNMYGTGIMMVGGSDNKISNNHIYNNGADGITVYDGSNISVISNNNIHNNNYGINVLGWETPGQNDTVNTIVANNEVYHNILEGISVQNNATGTIIDGNQVYENKQHGIIIDKTNYTIISANNVHDNSWTQPNLYDGIRIVGTSPIGVYHTIIKGNIVWSDHRKTQRRSIGIFGTSDNTVMVANIFHNNNNSNIDSAGTNNIYRDNDGYKTVNFGVSSVTNASTINHGLDNTPTTCFITPSQTLRSVGVTNIGSVNFGVIIINSSTSIAVGVAENVYWRCEV